MPDTSATIKYWIRQNDEYPTYYRTGSVRQGAWSTFLEAFAEMTGQEAEPVTVKDGQEISALEALDMLERGELDMVLGMPLEMQENHAWMKSDGIYESELTAYILKDSPQAKAGDFENCYWAVDSAIKDMLKGTPFGGHTVDFEDRTQLYGALERGDVYGVLDTRGVLDYEAFVGKNFKYRQCVAVSLPYTECVYVREGDGELLATVNEACERTAKTVVTAELMNREYTNLLADSYAKESGFRTATYALGGAAIVLAAGCAILFGRLRTHRGMEEAKLRTVLADDASKELLELDLRNRTLRSYNDFAIFGERGREIPNPVRLAELSELLGYDFVAHYSSVSTHISRKYSNRLIIHVGGEKLYISEEGERTGSILMLTMTKH